MKSAVLVMVVLGLANGQFLISPESRECREMSPLDEESLPDTEVTEYTSGEVMEVRAEIPEMMQGAFEFYLCPETSPGDEECLVKLPLDITGGLGKQFDVSEIPSPGQYTIPLDIPEDITCEKCTLMWVFVESYCPEDNELPCITTKTSTCADISIAPKKELQKRFGDFFKDILGHAVRGAARHIGNCKSN